MESRSINIIQTYYKPKLIYTYQLNCILTNSEMTNDYIIKYAIRIVLQWAKNKVPLKFIPQKAYRGETFVNHLGNFSIEAICLDEENSWSLQLSHPDTGMFSSPVDGRQWHSEIALRAIDDKVHFGIKISCSDNMQNYSIIKFIRPNLIKLLADKIGLSDIASLRKSWIINDQHDIDTLFSYLVDKTRKLPVIIISELYKPVNDMNRIYEKSLIDPQYLADKLIGHAFVFFMTKIASAIWEQFVGNEWSVYDGAVRTYYPNIDFDNDDPFMHPKAIKDTIFFREERDDIDKTILGPEAFSQFILNSMRKFSAKNRFSWDSLIFLNEARVRLTEKTLSSSLQYNRCLKCTDIYTSRINALEQQIVKANDDTEYYYGVAIDSDKENELLKRENHLLRLRIDSITASMSYESSEDSFDYPSSYDEMGKWVEDNLVGKLRLHPRAVKGLKKACYKDIELVYKCLRLLAVCYRDLRKGLITLQQYNEECMKLLVDDGQSITETRAGEEGDEYFVLYPLGNNRNSKRMLDRHLSKGIDRNEENCLRVYYFWDEIDEVVVVGWLPGHLDIRTT